MTTLDPALSPPRALQRVPLCFLTLLLGLSLTTTACSGCGDDAATPADTNAVSADSGGDMSSNPGDLVSTAPELSYVALDVDPTRVVHLPGARVTITATAFDQRDEALLQQPAFAWSVSPEGAATREAATGSWTLEREGAVTLSACAGEGGATRCAEARLNVDAAPPALMILEPSPGEEIDGAISSAIAVRGVVTDSNRIEGVFVNGQAVTPEADGTFSAEVAPHFGVNHIRAVALDGRRRESATVELDVLFGESFHPALAADSGLSGARFEDGLAIHLGQRFFDDQSRLMTTPEGAERTDDLADVLALLLEELDLLALLPNPVVSSSALTLSVERIALNAAQIELDITDQGLELYLAAPGLEVDTLGALDIEGTALDLSGGITASVSILASIAIDKSSAEAPFVVEVSRLDVAIEEASPSFNDPQADAIFTLAESALRLQLEGAITEALSASFIDAVPQLLATALNGLEETIREQDLSFEAPFSPEPIAILFSGEIDEVMSQRRRALILEVDASLAARGAPSYDSLGVAMTTPEGALSAAEWLERGRAQIALRLGLINGLLHGLWNTGLLELDATTLLPPDLSGLIKEARLKAKLAPVIKPASQGAPHDLVLEIGQLELELRTSLSDQLVTYGVSLGAGVDLDVIEGALTLEIAEEPELAIWVIEVEGGGVATLGAEELEGLFRTALWPQLTESLKESLALKLPTLELEQLGAYAPRLSDLTLSFEQIDRVEVRSGFILIHAQLAGELPPPTP